MPLDMPGGGAAGRFPGGRNPKGTAPGARQDRRSPGAGLAPGAGGLASTSRPEARAPARLCRLFPGSGRAWCLTVRPVCLPVRLGPGPLVRVADASRAVAEDRGPPGSPVLENPPASAGAPRMDSRAAPAPRRVREGRRYKGDASLPRLCALPPPARRALSPPARRPPRWLDRHRRLRPPPRPRGGRGGGAEGDAPPRAEPATRARPPPRRATSSLPRALGPGRHGAAGRLGPGPRVNRGPGREARRRTSTLLTPDSPALPPLLRLLSPSLELLRSSGETPAHPDHLLGGQPGGSGRLHPERSPLRAARSPTGTPLEPAQ